MATRVLKAKIWINSICMGAFWVHFTFAVSKASNLMKILTAKQLTVVVISLPGLVFFTTMASTWTYLILLFGLSQPSRGPSAAGQRGQEQRCNGYIDFWKNNRNCIGWMACSFLIPHDATATVTTEGSPSTPKTPSPEAQPVHNSKAGIDSDGVHGAEGR
ncbi:hypothetical protein PC9H_004337 [Pleurotus ostreatus]|uniref:Uncharacterized protein n=1 Tax=Pleurotus ostreatus TaxID=5322 RepID=A0A8H7DYU7_PLEOS|nr:uncharacterized protein PC9H_004337 [Pleurotus ostreatus]KAF7437496.1 hypothetical protein PC9H_004337 [Pleurotus ostreatus]